MGSESGDDILAGMSVEPAAADDGFSGEESAADGGNTASSRSNVAGRGRGRGRGKGRGRDGADGKARGRGRGRGAGTGKRKGATHQDASGADDETTKKCKGYCKKTKPTQDFNKDQSQCRECYNSKRQFGRVVESQSENDWWDGLCQDNPREADRTLKAFFKHNKQQSKAKFSILHHRRRLTKREGARRSGRSKKMWEQEYIEEMAKTEHGNMIKDEAKRKWKEMDDDKEKYPSRDFRGPHGNLRLKVRLGDYESSFSEVADSEELEAEGPPKKKARPEDFEKAVSTLLSQGSQSVFLNRGDNDSDPVDDCASRKLRNALEGRGGLSIMNATEYGDVKQFQKGTPQKNKRQATAMSQMQVAMQSRALPGRQRQRELRRQPPRRRRRRMLKRTGSMPTPSCPCIREK